MMLLRACYGVRGSFPSLAATAAATVVSVSLGKSTVALCYGCIATLLRRSRSVAPLSLERVLLLRTTARSGAVSDLWLTLEPFQLAAETIGNAPLAQANGLCGSAYVDFLATARSSGLLGLTGRFEASAWENIPAQFRHVEDGERALRLADGNGAGALRVSEVDVALLLQAKAAIGAGIEVLLETAGIRAADIGKVYLAGGFGMHLNVAHAIAIGLLPGFREEQVQVVGNTSLAGALLALVDRTTLDEMEELREQVEVIELNLADGFEDRYIEHLLLP